MDPERDVDPGPDTVPPWGLILRTSRLHLRPWEEADAAVHRQLWSERDPRVPAHRRIGADGRPTVADLEEWIRQSRETVSAEVPGTLVVELVGDGHGGHEVGGAGGTNGEAPLPIGYCGLIRTPHGGEDRIEIAYELLQEFQGRGIATEAADAVLEYAYAAGHRRIWASVREWNTASFRVLQKLGFFDTDERDKNEVHGDSLWMLREWDCEGTGDADHGGSRGRGRPS